MRVNEKCIGMCDKHRMTLDFNETHVINQQFAEMNVWLVNIEIFSVRFFVGGGGEVYIFGSVRFGCIFLMIHFHFPWKRTKKLYTKLKLKWSEEKWWCIIAPGSRNIIKTRNKHYSQSRSLIDTWQNKMIGMKEKKIGTENTKQ